MTFAISDLHEITIRDDDLVVLIGNLIENAIHECERITTAGCKAVIQVKLVKSDEQMILTVRNPVLRKMEIKENRVQDRIEPTSGEHGIGLVNVREVTDKYDGSFVISCDDREFTAVVMISLVKE